MLRYVQLQRKGEQWVRGPGSALGQKKWLRPQKTKELRRWEHGYPKQRTE